MDWRTKSLRPTLFCLQKLKVEVMVITVLIKRV